MPHDNEAFLVRFLRPCKYYPESAHQLVSASVQAGGGAHSPFTCCLLLQLQSAYISASYTQNSSITLRDNHLAAMFEIIYFHVIAKLKIIFFP